MTNKQEALKEIKEKLDSLRPENLIDKKKQEAARQREKEILREICEKPAE